MRSALVALALCVGCTSPYPNIVMPSVPDPPPPVPRVAARLYLLSSETGPQLDYLFLHGGVTVSLQANLVTHDGRGVPDVQLCWTVSSGRLILFRDYTDRFGQTSAALSLSKPATIEVWTADGSFRDRITIPPSF